MLRSLFTGISGLRSHQTMLDVTGNNIANVNTTGYKSSRTVFEDTLSQLTQGAAAGQNGNGGVNPAQVGLGVQVAAITSDLTQGAAQQTGRSLDMMINGDGYFVISDNGEQLYSRNGAFLIDGEGRLTTSSGGLLQGWTAVGGVLNTNQPIGNITLPITTTMGAQATENAVFSGNLPTDAEAGTEYVRSIQVYDAAGTARTLELTFTRTGAGWDVAATDGTATATDTLTFNADGTLATGGALTIGGVDVDLSSLTGYANLATVEASSQDGQSAGVLTSFSVGTDGTLTGVFSNDLRQVVGQIAVGFFTNPGGLEKAGGSLLRTSANSGDVQVGVAGAGGRGTLSGGALEMSNVDLSQEFTNMIIAQRGFQAGSRVITTSDEVLQELVNLKR